MAKNMIEFYMSQVANFFGKGSLISKKNMSLIGVRPLYDKIITQSSVKRTLMITEIPKDLPFNLNAVLNRKINRLHPGCKVIINTDFYKSSLHRLYRTPEFNQDMGNALAAYERYKSLFDGQDDSAKQVGKVYELGPFSKFKVTRKDLDRLRHIYDSYSYIHKVVTSQGKMLEGFMFIELVGPTTRKANKAFEELCDALTGYGFSYIPLYNLNYKYLSKMSPTSFSNSPDKEGGFESLIMSTSNLAYLQPYQSRGFVGDGYGTPLGIDLGSNAPLMLNFFKTADRQINMFLCPSGKGKTFACMYMVLFLMNSGIHCSIIDVKGDEWNRLLKKFKGIEISLGDSFVNTSRLDDIVDLIDGDMETAKMFYKHAIDSTVDILFIMSGYSEMGGSDSVQARFIIADGVTKFFNKNNVIDYNYKSFVNTKNFTYKAIIDSFYEFLQIREREKHKDLITTIIDNVNSFIGSSNITKGREITIGDVLESPLVIYSLGRNANQNSNPIVESVNTFMISYMDMKKIYIRKKDKKGTACFYEEMQRSEEFSRLVTFINSVVTGARSSNVTVFLLCNNPSTLLLKSMQGIKSNISSYFIGPMDSESDIEILNQLGLDDVVDDVRLITKEPDKYNHCFVSKFNTGDEFGSCIYTALAPPDIVELFNTRDGVEA